MSIMFRPAVRQNVGLLIGLAGSSGSGKTYTAMRLAKGMAGDTPFCCIDTEAGRATHYAEQFRFDHADLRPPFEPRAYAEAIVAADLAQYPVIIVDSCSHEHAGEGGILDMQEAEFQRLGARAKEKIEMVRVDGKREVRKKQTATGLDGWVPICEKTLPYELTASFLLMASRPGVPLPIKLQEQHRALVPLDQPITETCGQRLAAWARGGSIPKSATPALAPSDDRAPLIAEIKSLAVTIPAREKVDAAQTYLSGLSLEQADVAQLADLLAWCRTRTAAA